MSASRARTESFRMRLAIAATFTFGLAGITLLGGFGLAGAPPFTPKVEAAFKDKDQLQVAVTLDSKTAAASTGKITLDLVDAKGNATDVIEQDAKGSAYHFSLKVAKKTAEKETLRVRLAGQEYTVALEKVLLAKGHETSLFAGQEYHSGSTGSLNLTVQGVKSLTENVARVADVTIELKPQAGGKTVEIYKGATDVNGQSNAQFDIPSLPEGAYTLVVTTKSFFGEDKLEHPIQLTADAKILLVSDKPVYQPGQLMHLRALVLSPFDMKPVANKELSFEVEDPKGNKVFRRSFKTSEYGIASVDFQLADEVNMGDYQLHAVMDSHRADKAVSVKRYVLPKFKVEVTSDKPFYLPKEKVKGTLQADYFFGKPVANSKVEVVASTFDVEFRKFQTWNGETDAKGNVKFEIQLPDYFVGQPLQKGDALLKLEVRVTDTADHDEKVVKSYTVSDQPIKVSLIAEGGKIVPDMENRIFAAAIYPDGSPAPNTTVQLWLGKVAKGDPLAKVKTSESGLAEFTFTPKASDFRQGNGGMQDIELVTGRQQIFANTQVLDLRAEAQDSKGSKAVAVQELNSQPFGENILLRLDKAIYTPAESLNIDIHSSAGLPIAYVDVIRAGQVMLTRWVDVKDGKATQRLELPQNVFGSLEVHAYQMLHTGEIIRDSRVVYVQPKNDLKIEVKADKEMYAPGQNGRIQFMVTDSAGKPTAAALGIIIVDEAVYALQDLQPGLEKVYFTLQEELLKPQVQLNPMPGQRIDNVIMQPLVGLPQQQIAEVLLTAVKMPPVRPWAVQPALQRQQQFANVIQQIGTAIYNSAWNQNPKTKILVMDAKTKKWDFSPTLIEDLTKPPQQMIDPQFLTGAFGEKVTLADARHLEPGFTPENLAKALTIQRLNQLIWTVIHYTNNNKAAFYKNGAWDLPATVLNDAIKSQKLDDRWTRDAWEKPFRLVKQQTKVGNPTGQPQFDFYEIVSNGPDGLADNKDDLRSGDVKTLERWNWYGGNWWYEGDRARMPNAGPQNGLARGDRVNQFGGGFGGGIRADQMRAFGEVAPMAAAGGGRGGAGGVAGKMAMPMAAPAGQMMNREMAASDLSSAKSTSAPQPSGPTGSTGSPAPRVREFFPETMLWQPALITDDKGIANLAVNFADSITTWRLSASASSHSGFLGGANVPLKVFQDFFVDIDLPLNLTQGDEVAFPVAVYNYLKTPQTVKLDLAQEAWFELIDGKGTSRSLDLKPNEVTSVSYRIRANKIGMQPLNVKAIGTHMSDAVRRSVEVVPNGQKMEKVATDRLNGTIKQTLMIPENAVEDASKIVVKIYPGVMAQVMDGLDGMLRMPGGCFEQTSSTAYPNILVVDYLRKNKITSPEAMLKAEQYLNVGYQRLLTFERPGGGFDWWGSGEPLVWLSAYGLNEFADMSKVYPIDKGIIGRTQQFLMNKRGADGTWSNVGATHNESIASMGDPKMLLTSYVTWSLLESGFPKDQLKTSTDYIKKHISEANNNAYILALACNALASYDAKDATMLTSLKTLSEMRHEVPEWKAINFPAKTTSLTYARGDYVTIETTALTALAMLKTGQFTNEVNRALTFLVKSKDGQGSWGSTSATLLSLKALLAGMGGNQVKGMIPFTITVNGKEAFRGKVDEQNADLLQTFDLKDFTKVGANEVEIAVGGESNLMYQMVARHFEPWKSDPKATKKPAVDIDVSYDRTKLTTDDTLKAKATLRYNGQEPTYNVILDLGIAPGFNVDANDFTEMVNRKQIQKFSVTSRQVIVYLGDVKPGDVLTFDYTLKARFPLRAQTPESIAYEYYTPSNRATAHPVELVVEERK